MSKKDNNTDGDAVGTVRARVLVDCVHGSCNDVIEIDPALLESLAGVLDADPAAVAYADSLAAG
ncbi:hypothetical protein ASC94_10095 [Massilia sp. Root418]|uniref:hypothetical protein n=1 Tax=Massilia sp. Root418 TaxID=1736532 RepID=UPI0006F3D696|nr:hypothetical protein [Massilia sp. Root418]KQW97132.1 hypothetical protein ASC94_10095 [Massilia sp. Root418]